MAKTNRTAVVVAVMMANFLAAIDVSIVGTAMPTIIGTLGGLPLMSWVFSAFLLASTVTVPIYGKLSDLYGRKIIFMFSSVVLIIGSVLCGIAESMVQLIIYRTIQGLGAGGIMAVAQTILGDIFSAEERGKIQGWFSGVWGVSAVVGPLLGGLMVSYLDWPWVFYINVPIALAAILILAFALHEDLERKKHKIDYVGSITLTVSMTALLFALLTGGNQYEWFSPQILGLIVVAVLVFVWFLFNERRVTEPMLPLDLFRSPLIAVASIANFLLGAVLVGITSYMPSYAQGVLGGTATAAGLLITPISIGWPIASIIGGPRMIKWGYRRTAMIGGALVGISSLLLIFVTPAVGYWYVMPVLLVLGMGMGLTTLAFLVSVQATVPWNRRGIATASLQFIRSLGSSVGVAVMGAVMNARILDLLRGDPDIQAPLEATNNLLDPEKRALLEPSIVDRLSEAFASGLHYAFLLVAVFGIGALVVTLYYPRDKTSALKS
ncbi:MFS transporter [Tumebacillus algifaecis]|uniref:MFS transporter n=1 Tax=Tumebacillus algifaecis TaxID=1214604 RepID=A0A223D122_9BACL|nr:MDR family MFS transporter [Tumebacillus algifaecis]ASS75064.1 MFS transporter [Tumebacillus algifaecis]